MTFVSLSTERTLYSDATSAVSTSVSVVGEGAVASNIDLGADRRGIPFAIPRDQLYYWTGLWQEGVKVAREALEHGDYVEFDSDDPQDVVHWLFSGDDE